MSNTIPQKFNTSPLLLTAAFIIIIAGLRAAASIAIPFLLAIFISIICLPPLRFLQSKKIPNMLAVLIVILGFLFIGFLLLLLFESSLGDFSSALPFYQERLNQLTKDAIQLLQPITNGSADQIFNEYINPSVLMQLIANSLSSIGAVLTNSLLILLTVIFILLEASGLPSKIKQAFSNSMDSLEPLENFINSVNKYLGLKTIISFFTGVCVYIWLNIFGIDFPVLWGLIAGIMNFIPNIGSIIAAVPAVLLALIQFGPGTAMIIIAGYIVINMVFGNFIEPRLMGQRLGLSTLVVFVSLVFWGWVFGPIGMLLSVPLTMILKIALEGNPSTEHWAVLLGPSKTTI
jgi:predicted PurR-regulated permease PerM